MRSCSNLLVIKWSACKNYDLLVYITVILPPNEVRCEGAAECPWRLSDLSFHDTQITHTACSSNCGPVAECRAGPSPQQPISPLAP